MLPQVNASLISIASGGTQSDWDQAASPGTPKWQGDDDAYVLEKMKTSLPNTAGGMARVKDTSILISADLQDVDGNPIDINGGDVITYSFMGQLHSRVVADESGAYLPEIAVQEYIRIHFTNEAPEAAMESY